MSELKRLKPEVRRDQILAVAIDIAIKQGYNHVTRERIAEQANISTGLVNRVFNTMAQLRRAVMRAAIHSELLPIVAAGLGCNCHVAHGASEQLKHDAMNWLIKNGGE